MTKHAKVGPSALSRVMACPASVRQSEGVEDETSEYAAEGTVLHHIAALCIIFGFEPHDFVGMTMSADGFDFEITSELVACIYDALDWIRELPGDLYVEERVSLERWMPEQFGTMDLGWYETDSKTLCVFDWKFGAGVPVAVVGNKQGRAYGLGFYETFLRPRGITPERVRIYIEQPRCPGGCRFSEPWEFEFAELLEFGAEMSAAFEAAQRPDAPFGPGEEACRFCLARTKAPAPGGLTGCRAHDEHMLSMLSGEFDSLDDLDGVSDITLDTNPTPDRRAVLVLHAKQIEKWLARLHDDSKVAAMAGRPDPGLELDVGRSGRREWFDPDLAEGFLLIALDERAFTFKVKSPTQAEADLRPRRNRPGDHVIWQALSRLVRQDPPKPILVAAGTAKSPPATFADEFEDLGRAAEQPGD